MPGQSGTKQCCVQTLCTSKDQIKCHMCLNTSSRTCTKAGALCANSGVTTWKKGVFTLVPRENGTQALSANKAKVGKARLLERERVMIA